MTVAPVEHTDTDILDALDWQPAPPPCETNLNCGRDADIAVALMSPQPCSHLRRSGLMCWGCWGLLGQPDHLHCPVCPRCLPHRDALLKIVQVLS